MRFSPKPSVCAAVAAAAGTATTFQHESILFCIHKFFLFHILSCTVWFVFVPSHSLVRLVAASVTIRFVSNNKQTTANEQKLKKAPMNKKIYDCEFQDADDDE